MSNNLGYRASHGARNSYRPFNYHNHFDNMYHPYGVENYAYSYKDFQINILLKLQSHHLIN